jgi:HD superfamily phosphohydrolase
MELIIARFKRLLTSWEVSNKLTQREVNLALAAALLHDIGHGPLSHTFEKVNQELSLKGEVKSHEEWGQEIITAKDSRLHQVLVNNFGSQFPAQVAKLIVGLENDRQSPASVSGFSQISIQNIISSLINSQLDADRMDYLLRDSFFTGVAYGNFDLSRLIRGLNIARQKGNYYICIPEKYLSTVEEYLLARYQMYKEIYSHPFKRQMELILSKIFQRAAELYQSGKLKEEELPAGLQSILQQESISVKDYIKLDDINFLGTLKRWKEHSEDILARLSSMFIDREKFHRLNLSDNSKQRIANFKTELLKLLSSWGLKIDNLEDSYFWLENPAEDDLYKELYQEEEESILILRPDGQLKDFIEVSNIIGRVREKKENKPDRRIAFISFSLLQQIEELSSKEITKIKELIDKYKTKINISTLS